MGRFLLDADDRGARVKRGNNLVSWFFNCRKYSKRQFIFRRYEFLRQWLYSFDLVIHFGFANFVFIIVCVLNGVLRQIRLDGE